MPSAVKPKRRRSPVRHAAFSGKSTKTKQAVGVQGSEPLAALAHDARNVVAALRLYCDLLAEPGRVVGRTSAFRERATGCRLGRLRGWSRS